MLLLPRRLIRSALLVGCLGLLLPAIAIAEAQGPAFRIEDKAKMFSEKAIQKAEGKIDAIKRDYDKDVLVETHAALPPDAQKEYKGLETDKEKNLFWREFADKRYEKRNVRGIYLIIVKNPTRYQFSVGKKTKVKAFTHDDLEKTEKILTANLKQDKFDEGLLAALNDIELTMNRTVGQSKSSTTPVSTKSSTGFPTTSMFSGIWGMICIGLVVVLGLWLVVGVFRALTGAGRPVDRPPYGNQAGYGGPQQGGGGYGQQGGGGGGGGGGGFMKGMLGGMLGAAGGMFLYDRFFGGHTPMGGPTSTPSAYGGTPASGDDDNRAGDGGGGDYGSSGTRDDAGGGGGDWGKKDDDGGGGSFGGGGDDGGGGSFGGGGDDGGGGSFGGGDGGGGGDW